ncbi:hypothetical protein KSX_93460 [Ktedonospora formicarum]|uniref:Uncharacterized protein n=1 Tax=Ktedonospora formicarum TaxID=2778364 RepID=A0A8J3IF16_9CHLR|nr:hypothetical protein KSX_93460 [Ktedonospora formicarum]
MGQRFWNGYAKYPAQFILHVYPSKISIVILTQPLEKEMKRFPDTQNLIELPLSPTDYRCYWLG